MGEVSGALNDLNWVSQLGIKGLVWGAVVGITGVIAALVASSLACKSKPRYICREWDDADPTWRDKKTQASVLLRSHFNTARENAYSANSVQHRHAESIHVKFLGARAIDVLRIEFEKLDRGLELFRLAGEFLRG